MRHESTVAFHVEPKGLRLSAPAEKSTVKLSFTWNTIQVRHDQLLPIILNNLEQKTSLSNPVRFEADESIFPRI